MQLVRKSGEIGAIAMLLEHNYNDFWTQQAVPRKTRR